MDISVYAINSTAISISWKPPMFKDVNGIIRNYILDIIEIESESSFINFTDYTSIFLTGLHPYYGYNITIRAVTIASGPASSIYNVITDQDSKTKQKIEHKIKYKIFIV